jgi:hypothetical protein
LNDVAVHQPYPLELKKVAAVFDHIMRLQPASDPHFWATYRSAPAMLAEIVMDKNWR